MAWLNAFWNLLAANWIWICVVLLPLVVQTIAKCHWTASQKAWTAFGLSALVGTLGAIIAGGTPSPQTLGTFILLLFGGSTATYLLFKQVNVTNSLLDWLLQLGSNSGMKPLAFDTSLDEGAAPIVVPSKSSSSAGDPTAGMPAVTSDNPALDAALTIGTPPQ